MELPSLPVQIRDVLSYIKPAVNQSAVAEYLQPFKKYESQLRQIYAQQPSHPAVTANHLVPIFGDNHGIVKIRARDLRGESEDVQQHYLLPLPPHLRRSDGTPATIDSLKRFKTNFNIFSESSLADLNWKNVVAAGSSVVTSLLPVDFPHNESKRSLRSYYHEKLAPASDVDLFLYGLNEEEAIEKIKKIEEHVRDSVLTETTTIRTKNAITIVSQYPTRHIQIVLRLYKTVSEILTGFDVDCSCVAYDGNQVWASPRAIGAYATQSNSIDLTRRSPSYENRLSKYSHRGFEVYCPILDRSRIDPTIFERSFGRVTGLARLLVLEKLPHPQDRDDYSAKRREERGRPPLPWSVRSQPRLTGNVKDAQPDDVAEWVEEDEVSNYHTFTIPYGPKYTARKVERLVYAKDLLLNAEWNKQKDRKTKLHRHPAFFGSVQDVIRDCCGNCPPPISDDDVMIFKEESKTFISGDLTFIKDDPGRQSIGSFNPITDEDWTEMAYIGNTAVLCQAIVDQDLDAIKDWFSAGDVDVNRRDHTGRTPLHLAVTCSSVKIIQFLMDRGARIVARLYNGMTALHLAAHRGDAQTVKILMERSQVNEAEEARKEELRKLTRSTTDPSTEQDAQMTDGDSDNDSDHVTESDSEMEDDITEGSFVKIQDEKEQEALIGGTAEEPDIYDVDILAWDSPVSPLHLAIMAGHLEVIKVLVDGFSADVMLPIKLLTDYIPRYPKAAILSLLLPLELPLNDMKETIQLLLERGATYAQADMESVSALHYTINAMKQEVLMKLNARERPDVKSVINNLVLDGWPTVFKTATPLITAIKLGSVELAREILSMGGTPSIDYESFAQSYNRKFTDATTDPEELNKRFLRGFEQPIIQAALQECMIDVIDDFIELGVDVNSLTTAAYYSLEYPDNPGRDETRSLLDLVRYCHKYLEEYEDERRTSKDSEESHVLPVQLESDISYLAGLPIGSYRHWKASRDLASARTICLEQTRTYEKSEELARSVQHPGEADKRRALDVLKAKFADLEKKLISLGAKSFYELHPNIKPPEENNNKYGYAFNYNEKCEPYKTEFKFFVADITPLKQDLYIQLFEAVFTGDTETVRHLCLDITNSIPPLQVAIKDQAGFSPFSLAVVRGHQQLASLILEIAAAQYQPPSDSKRARYTLYDENSDSDDEGGIKIYQDLIDDKFTMENVGDLAASVKSKVDPVTMMEWKAEFWRICELDVDQAKLQFNPSKLDTNTTLVGKDEQSSWRWFYQCLSNDRNRCQSSLSSYAILQNDMEILKFVLQKQSDYAVGDADNALENIITFPTDDLQYAMKLGRTEIIGELLQQRGVLMPLHKMAETSGVKDDAKPKYYQGLFVRGKKRKDWADAGRTYGKADISKQGAPLLSAIMDGSIQTIEYFLSDAPVRRYSEFAETFADDKRIQRLAKGNGGIDAALNSWIGSHTELALHIAVFSTPQNSAARVRLLLNKLPSSFLDKKCSTGDSPLQLALQMNNYPVAKILIEAGANQQTRNYQGNNILHTIYNSLPSDDPDVLKSVVLMLDQELVPKLLIERYCNQGPTSLTPLALLLNSGTSYSTSLLECMLDLSDGKDLEIMDGAGDYPLHRLVRANNIEAVKMVVNRWPDLIYRENATGMTPVDVVESDYLLKRIENHPTLHNETKDDSIRDKPAVEFIQTPEKEEKHLHHTMTELVKTYPGKRRLVSLLDANEVAKRLALQQQKQNAKQREKYALGLNSMARQYSESTDQNSPKRVKDDEVTWWMSRGISRMEQLKWVWSDEKISGAEAKMQKLKDVSESN